jgi:hypothetical protein
VITNEDIGWRVARLKPDLTIAVSGRRATRARWTCPCRDRLHRQTDVSIRSAYEPTPRPRTNAPCRPLVGPFGDSRGNVDVFLRRDVVTEDYSAGEVVHAFERLSGFALT